MRPSATIVLFALVVAACGRSTSKEQAAPDPSTKPLPTTPPKPMPKPMPEDEVRTFGTIDGKISLRSRSVVVGEPIVAMVEAKSFKGPLKVYVGGDQRNEAGYPTRLAMRALDAKGGVVCDTVDAPALPNFGGLGGEQTLAENETWTEGAVLNPMCPGLATPGDYRLILHRRLAHDGMITKTPGSAVPTSCDVYPVHEGPLPKGYAPGCDAQMDALPWITLETTLHVEPFDATRLRVATEARLKELAPKPSPAPSFGDTTRWRMDIWICGWLACACPAPDGGDRSDADLLSALPSSLPKSFPASCRSAGP